jgi:L-Ala-D/L-Glu epimerase
MGDLVASVEAIPVSVPYRHREVSTQVKRDGVSDVLVRVTTAGGLVGWGEACCGADTRSVEAAVHAMSRFVLGQDPWNRAAIRQEVFTHGLWQFRVGTGNFAWAGIDMALLDICGKAAEQPLYRLIGGLMRSSASYFYYLARGNEDDLAAQCADGLAAGYDVFYLKVGLNDQDDLAMLAAVREALGPAPRIRIDANGAWTLPQALRNLEAMSEHDVDFVEQPVRDHPPEQMVEARSRSPIRVCANEGLWSEADAYARISARAADVFCFSPYWVGSIESFRQLSLVAAFEGLEVCKHTHGELGIAAAAGHHVLLTLPNVVDGNQQTASMLQHDVLATSLPIASEPTWGCPDGAGLGINVDNDAVTEAAQRFQIDGQFLPWGDDPPRAAE